MTTSNAVPPDGGWGWVFVAGCALQWFFHGALVRSFSLIYEQMLVRFGASASATGAVYSFNIASSLLIAPLAAALSTRVTPRQGVFIGTAVMFTGMLATAFAPSLPVVYFTYGIMAGSGSGTIAAMRFITTPLWFRKKLGRATSLILMTDGLGVMALGPLLDLMFSHYGYTGTMMFIASISLHGLVVAMVMIPLPHPPEQNSKVEVQGSIDHDPLVHKKDEEIGGDSSKSPSSRSAGGEYENEEWAVRFENGVKCECSITNKNPKVSTEDDVGQELSCELATTNNTASSSEIDCNISQPKDAANNSPNLNNGGEIGSYTLVAKTEHGLLDLKNGSSHNGQVTDESSLHCDGCLSKFYSYLDVRLLKSSRFFTFSLLMTSSSLCSSMSNTHMAGMAMDRSIAPHQVAILLTIVGALAVVSKFSSGFLFDLRCFKAVRTPVLGGLGIISGLLLIFIPLTSGAPIFSFMWVLNQVVTSVLNTQESAVLNGLVPRKSYASAVGLSRCCRGLGVIIGPTIGGLLKDTTGNYSSTFFFGGSIFLFSSIIFEMNVLRRHLCLSKSAIKT